MPWRPVGEWMYRSAFSWPRHLLKMSSQLHASAALPSRKELPVPIGYEAGWTPEPVWTTWKTSWPYRDSNSEHSVVQPVVSRYTDFAIRWHAYRTELLDSTKGALFLTTWAPVKFTRQPELLGVSYVWVRLKGVKFHMNIFWGTS
jgi:hypothetical protein